MKSRNIAYALLTSILAVGGARKSAMPRTLPRTTRDTPPARPRWSIWAPSSRQWPAAQLRLRVLTIEPGGHIGMHSHKDRPAVVYFMQGTDTVTRDDGSSQTFHPGDTIGETGKTVHWHRNDACEEDGLHRAGTRAPEFRISRARKSGEPDLERTHGFTQDSC